MRLSTALRVRPGISQAMLLMASPANLTALESSGLHLTTVEGVTPDDLIIAVEGDVESNVESALSWAETELERLGSVSTPETAGKTGPRTLGESLRSVPGLNLALISVPGEYAYGEALKALKAGMNVFLFSSGVNLEDEAQLKQFAARRGLLMMGAECGTAVIDGVPLGFANNVRRGSIGLIGASGTGLQEVMCLIHNAGGGIAHAIGTGGRDLSEEVGGTTMLAGLDLLANDAATRVIVLLSKPPSPSIAARVIEAAAGTHKPTIVGFMGADPDPIRAAGLIPAPTLEQAAQLALAATGQDWPEQISSEQRSASASLTQNNSRRLVRGLFAGGTLCSEAALILQDCLGAVTRPTQLNPFPSTHTLLDLGEEEFTIGRPHPMIDAQLRADWMLRAAQDPQTAVVLFDIILGYGASADPTPALLDVIRQADPECRFVAHVCGTDGDPQGLDHQIERLRAAGVLVCPTNAGAARLAAEIVT